MVCLLFMISVFILIAGNLHKWVYCPRSCAFLWMNPKRKHAWLKPLVTSAFENDGLSKAFAYEGKWKNLVVDSDGIDQDLDRGLGWSRNKAFY